MTYDIEWIAKVAEHKLARGLPIEDRYTSAFADQRACGIVTFIR